MNYNQFKLPVPVKLLTFMAVILTFFVRPFALGLDNSLITNVMLLAVAVLISIRTPTTLYNHQKVLRVTLLIYLIFAFYNGIANGSFEKSFFPVLQVVTVYLIFRNYSVMRLFFKLLKGIFIVLIILALINFVLVVLTGDKDSLVLIKDIRYLKDTYEFSLYFPLTWSEMGWNIFGNFDFSAFFPRQYYFFIEPGMVPPFFTAFIFILWSDKNEKHKWMQTFIFIIGIIMSFSTGGPLILMFSISLWYLSKNKSKLSLFTIILFAIGICVAWYAYNYMPFFGRQAKMEISAGTQLSIETHETFAGNIIVGVALLAVYGLISLKIKYDKVLPVVITAIIALGYMSNYIGFTTLATMFLFWDSAPQQNKERFVQGNNLNYNVPNLKVK